MIVPERYQRKEKPQTFEELFEQETNKLWDRLILREDTIFEGSNNFTKRKHGSSDRWMRFKASPAYQEAFVSDLIGKKHAIHENFWANILGDMYDDTIAIMEANNILEESRQSFETNFKLENTARLILENGVFRNFQEKKEITDILINESFYPTESQEGFFVGLQEGSFIERSFQWVIQGAKIIKGMWLMMTFLFITPATVLVGGTGMTVARNIQRLKGNNHKELGMHPTIKNMFSIVEKFGIAGSALGGGLMAGGAAASGAIANGAIANGALATGGAIAASGAIAAGGALVAGSILGALWRFMNKDLIEISTYLNKLNTLDNEYLQEVLSGIGADSDKIIKKCWIRNKHQPLGTEADALVGTFLKNIQNFNSGLQNLLRFPLLRSAPQIAMLLKEDASNPAYQKMFFDFRICMYDKIFDIIIGYAEAIYSIDDASYDIIIAANRMHNRKNFKEFFKIDPKTENEAAMFKLIKALVAMDDMVIKLKLSKGELVGDANIDRFIIHMEQKIKQTYSTLDDMANQSKHDYVRFGSRDPDDEKVKKIEKEERDDKKRSIFRD